MKDRLIEFWERGGIIKHKAVIEAFKAIPREAFVPERFLEEAYGDYPLPIPAGQTISQPTTVVIMTDLLELKKGDKVFEVGTGSGYQAALIARIVGSNGRVITTEIIRELAELAKNNIKKLGIKNIEVIHTDGSKGYIKEAPYDKIIMTAACPQIPKPLIEQLKINGIIVAPVGPAYGQDLVKVIKKKDKLDIQSIGGFIFVPLQGDYGYE